MQNRQNAKDPSLMTLRDVRDLLRKETSLRPEPPFRSAVLVTLLEEPVNPMPLSDPPEEGAGDGGNAKSVPGLYLLYEQRAFSLKHQPGEVCFPGGAVEKGETPEEAAVREASEELLVTPDQVSILGTLGIIPGPRNSEVHIFIGTLSGYRGTSSPDEVARVFTIPLSWLAAHPPVIYEGSTVNVPGEDFPVDLIPGGRSYRWGKTVHYIPIYHGTSPVLWGFTARVTARFLAMLEGGRVPW